MPWNHNGDTGWPSVSFSVVYWNGNKKFSNRCLGVKLSTARVIYYRTNLLVRAVVGGDGNGYLDDYIRNPYSDMCNDYTFRNSELG